MHPSGFIQEKSFVCQHKYFSNTNKYIPVPMFFFQEVQEDIQAASDGGVTIETFHVTIESLTKYVEQMTMFTSMTDDIIASKFLPPFFPFKCHG